MIAPDLRIRAHVSGLRPDLKRGAKLMIFQTFIDETGSKTTEAKRLFLMGGLIADVPSWERFALAWDAELKRPPGLEYFKLSQALSMKDQFATERGWTEALRDDRVMALAEIARSHVERGVAVWMRHDVYNELVVPFSRHKHLKDPYFPLFHHITEIVSRHARDLSGMTEIKYVFDENGEVGIRARDFWDRIAAASKGAIIGSTPNLENDKKFSPLQAADLYVGLTRADIEDKRTKLIEDAVDLFNSTKLKSIGAEYTREDMLSTAAFMIVSRPRGG